MIVEDVDLWIRDRKAGGSSAGLSELLQAMAIAPEARILTLASTNDASTLDTVANPHRTVRFSGRGRLPGLRCGCADARRPLKPVQIAILW